MESINLRKFVKMELLYLFILMISVQKALSTKVLLQLDGDENACSEQKTIRIGELSDYELTWTGEEPADVCKYRFTGGGEDGSDKYKVCVEVVTYLIQDCNVALKYDTKVDGEFLKTEHRCGVSPPDICSDENQNFDIQLYSNNEYDTLKTHPSSFTLRITTSKTFDNSVYIATLAACVAGGVVGLIVITVVIIAICILCNRRGKDNADNVYKEKPFGPDDVFNPQLPYTIPVQSKREIKRAPSFSSMSSEQFDYSQFSYEPSSSDRLDKTAHIY